MSKPLNFLAIPVLALGLATAALAESKPGADTVVATVNGTDITLGHMIQLRQSLPPQYAQVPAEVLFSGILDQMVRQELLKQSHKGAMAKNVKLALENEERALIANKMVETLLQERLSEGAIEQAYEEKYGNTAPGKEYHASHILVETEDAAKAVIAELEGGADFAATAKAKSTGPSGPSGGDLSWFGKGMMVPPFEQAVTGMVEGDISAPVQTQFGWHVIKLHETRLAEVPPLEEVRGEILNDLEARIIEEHIDELTRGAKVERKDTGLDPALLNDTALIGD